MDSLTYVGRDGDCQPADNSRLTSLGGGYNGFTPVWEIKHEWEDVYDPPYWYYVYYPGYPPALFYNAVYGLGHWSRDAHARVMILPSGQAPAGTTALYLVEAQVTNEDSGLQVPGNQMRFQNQLSGTVTVDMTHDDGLVWSQGLVSAPAGATNVEITPAANTQNISFNNMRLGGLRIVDANTGSNLTTRVSPVIVGQQMNLKCQLMVSNEVVTNYPLANFQWTVPGLTFTDYVATAESAVLYTNLSLNNSNVVFYWADGGIKQVQCSATVNGTKVTDQATFNVLKPTAQIITSGGTVALNYYQGGIRLHCGDVFGTVGMWFNVTNFSVPPPFSGNTNINWFQMVTSQLRREQASSGQWYRKQGTNLCDGGIKPGTSFPYPFDETFQYPIATDSPKSDALVNYIGVDYFDTFDMWLMYKPNGGKWVPLQKVSWHWDGAGNWNGTNWTLTSHTDPGSPTGVNIANHPTWRRNVDDLQWQPE
jgi:hypothetical protein